MSTPGVGTDHEIDPRADPTGPTMTCDECVQVAAAVLDGTADDGEQARMAAHVRDCDACAEELEALHAAYGTVHGVEPEPVAPETRAELLAMFRAWHRGRTDG